MQDRESSSLRRQGKGEAFERHIAVKANMVGGYTTRRNVEIRGSEVDVIGILAQFGSGKTEKTETLRYHPERIVIECKDWREGEYVREETIWRTVCLANQWDAHPFLAISDCDLTEKAKKIAARYYVGILTAGKIKNESEFHVFEQKDSYATQIRPKSIDEVQQFRECWKKWPYKDDN